MLIDGVMDHAHLFRRHLKRRLLLVAGLMTAIGCDADVVNDSDDDGGGGNTTVSTSVASSTSGDNGWDYEWCIPPGGAGGAGGRGGAGGLGGAGGAGECPTKAEAERLYVGGQCGSGYVIDGPTYKEGQCCYWVHEDSCVTGRPFIEAGELLLSEVRAGRGWCDDGPLPDVDGLSSAQRNALARAWSEDASGEHASIASFARFALELMACGAPAELVAAAHRAALDEVRHARACFRLASAYAGESLGAGPLPLGNTVEVSSDLADVAARAAVEGCVGETLAAIQAAEQLALTTDPAVREVLAAIANEEAQHAELAWRTVAWALSCGGEKVRRAVGSALHGAMSSMADAVRDDAIDHLEAHGRLDTHALRSVRRRALEEVVRPCAEALLRQRSSELRV